MSADVDPEVPRSGSDRPAGGQGAADGGSSTWGDLDGELEELRVLERRDPPLSRANDLVVGGCALGAAVLGLGFAITLVLGAPIGVYGPLLGVAFLLLGFAVRRFFVDRFPDVEAAEARPDPDLERDPEPDDEPIAAIAPLGRRPLLARILLGSAAVFGASLLALVPSLGPRVGEELRRTPWARGRPLVTTDGDTIRADDVAVGGILTAWPQGEVGFERAAVVVLRLGEQPLEPTRPEWVVDGSVVAYSKICTHAGCPVALFRERDDALFCPCHQSTFDVRRGCTPTFGPAARALPQLPLGVGDDGALVALGDFEEQVGPAFG